MSKQGKIVRASYRSFGQQLQQDVLSVEFEVDGELHEHPYPNMGWSYNNPALLFLGFIEKKPTDIDGTSFEVDEVEVPIKWLGGEHGYLIDDKVLLMGNQKLQEADWFNPEGQVHDTDNNQGVGGMNVEPGTGNQGAVEIGGSE